MAHNALEIPWLIARLSAIHENLECLHTCLDDIRKTLHILCGPKGRTDDSVKKLTNEITALISTLMFWSAGDRDHAHDLEGREQYHVLYQNLTNIINDCTSELDLLRYLGYKQAEFISEVLNHLHMNGLQLENHERVNSSHRLTSEALDAWLPGVGAVTSLGHRDREIIFDLVYRWQLSHGKHVLKTYLTPNCMRPRYGYHCNDVADLVLLLSRGRLHVVGDLGRVVIGFMVVKDVVSLLLTASSVVMSSKPEGGDPSLVFFNKTPLEERHCEMLRLLRLQNIALATYNLAPLSYPFFSSNKECIFMSKVRECQTSSELMTMLDGRATGYWPYQHSRSKAARDAVRRELQITPQQAT